MSATTTTVHVLYENPDWLPPLVAGLEAEGLRAHPVEVRDGVFDPAVEPDVYLHELVRIAGRVAQLRGAALMEMSDLDPPGSPLYSAALATGAHPWSRVVEKMA